MTNDLPIEEKIKYITQLFKSLSSPKRSNFNIKVLLEDFLLKDKSTQIEAIEQYKNALITIGVKTNPPQSDEQLESSQKYIDNMNYIMSALVDTDFIKHTFVNHSEGINIFLSNWIAALYNFVQDYCTLKAIDEGVPKFSQDDLDKLDPYSMVKPHIPGQKKEKKDLIYNWSAKGIENVENMFFIISRSSFAFEDFLDFLVLEKKLRSREKDFSGEIKENFLRTLILSMDEPFYVDQLSGSVGFVERKYLEMVAGFLNNNTVENVWEDNITNTILRLRNAQKFHKKNLNLSEKDALNESAKVFQTKNYPQKTLSGDYAILSEFIEKNRKGQEPTIEDQCQFVGAYMKIYVYNLVNDGQDDGMKMLQMDKFVLEHMDIFKADAHKSHIDYEKLAIRAIQDILIRTAKDDKEFKEAITKERSDYAELIDFTLTDAKQIDSKNFSEQVMKYCEGIFGIAPQIEMSDTYEPFT